MSVPLPGGVREGQSWHLVLTSHAQGRPHIINLQGPQLGKTGPLPVMSMPITFSSHGYKGDIAGKQDQIERVYRLPLIGDGQNAFLTIREQTSYDLDKVSSLWILTELN